MNKAIYAIICIILIVSTPVTSFGYYNDPTEGDTRDLGEALTINVDHVSPTPITSDLFQHRAANIHVFLSGKTLGTALFGDSQSPTGAPFYGDMKIKHIDLNPDREASKYIQGGLTSLVRPKGEELIVDANGNIDLGYTTVRLKRQPLEDKVPDEITIEVDARIYFDVESGFGVLSTQSFNLAPQENEEAWLDNLEESSLWGGRGYIRVIEINGNTARVQLYDGNKRKIGFANQIKLTAGGEPKEVTLPGAPSLLENRINLKLERVSKNENKARLLIEEDVGGEIISSTKEYVAGMKINSEWVVKEIFSDGLMIKDSDGNELFISYDGNNPIKDPCANFEYLTINQLKTASSTQLYCQAIEDYKKSLQLAETPDEKAFIEMGIGSAYHALNSPEKYAEYLLMAKSEGSTKYSKKIEKKIESANVIIQNKYSYVKINDLLVTLIEIDDHSKQSKIDYALLNSFDESIINFDFTEGTIGKHISPEIIDGSGNKYKWVIKSISSNEVVIQQEFTELNSRNRPEENTRTLEIGKKTQVPFGAQSKFIYINKIEVAESAIITVTPGTRDNYGTSQFTIHLPIEKRLWQWTPEEIDKMIASTDKTINKLDGIINRLGSIISTWKGVCYATFAALTIKNAFFSNPAKRLIENKVRYDCEEEFGTNTQASVNCFNDAKQEIEEKVETSQRTKDELDELFKDLDFEDEESLQGIADRLNMDVTNLTLLHRYGDLSGQKLYKTMYDEEVWQDGSLDFNEELERVNRIDKSIKEEVGNQELSDKEIKEIELRYRLNVGSGSLTTPSNAFFTDQNTHAQQVLQGSDIISRPNNNPFPLYKDGDQKYIIDTEGNKIVVTPKMDGSEILSSSRGDFYEADGNIYLAGLSEGAFLTEYNTVPRIYFDDETNTPILIPFQYNGGEESLSFANYIQVDEDAERRGGYRFSVWNIGSDGIPDTEDDKLVMSSTQLHPDTRLKENDRLAYEIERTYQQAVPLATKDEGSIIKFNGQDIIVEQYEGNIGRSLNPNGECEDSMSPTDCKILYNVCDPVMCPPSRFNFGGKWDLGGDAGSVVQKGIIGSITLGWGNGDILPICLTGIHAGLENIYSMFGSFRDCLEVAKTSGESVGICNEIRSLYMCNILWEEALALVNVFGKLQSFISTSIFGSSGGGEYKLWESSWSRLGDSVNFFTKSYASSAFSAFRGRSTSEVGSTLCKQAIFGKTPAGGDLLGQLTSPESPPQFTGWFEEDRNSEVNLQSGFINTQATIGTGQSTYRIYYHIYAGRNKDIRYKVILKDINGQPITVNDPGLFQGDRILKRGESVDQSFTLPNLPPGFVEMCIIIDGIPECGFGSTSSGFSTQYLKDELIKSSLNDNINTAEQCSPRERSYVPGLFTSGVKRVCAAYDPDGVGQDWEFVGTCGEDEIGRNLGNCYLYSQGIKDSIHSTSYNLTAIVAEAQRNNDYTQAQEQERRDEIQQSLNDDAEEEYIKLSERFEPTLSSPENENEVIKLVEDIYSLISRTSNDKVIMNSYKLSGSSLSLFAAHKDVKERRDEIQQKFDEKATGCTILYDADVWNKETDKASFRYLFGPWQYKLEGSLSNTGSSSVEVPTYADWVKITNNQDCDFIKKMGYSDIFYDICKGLVGKNFGNGVKEIVETANDPPGRNDDSIKLKTKSKTYNFGPEKADTIKILNYCGQSGSGTVSNIQTEEPKPNQRWLGKEIEIEIKSDSGDQKYSISDSKVTDLETNLVLNEDSFPSGSFVAYLMDKYTKSEKVERSIPGYSFDDIRTELLFDEIKIKHNTGDKKEYTLKKDTMLDQFPTVKYSEGSIFKWTYYALSEEIEQYGPFKLEFDIKGGLFGSRDKSLEWTGFYVKGDTDKKASFLSWDGLLDNTQIIAEEENPDNIKFICNEKTEATIKEKDFDSLINWLEDKASRCTLDVKTTTSGLSSIYNAIRYAQSNTLLNRKCDCGENCDDYAKWIMQYSNKYGFDPILGLSLIMQENSCKQWTDKEKEENKIRTSGCVGAMQICSWEVCQGLPGLENLNKDNWRKELGDNTIQSISNNLQCGFQILKVKYDSYNGGVHFDGCEGRDIIYTGWDAALRGYNGLGCQEKNGEKITSQDYYVENIINRMKSLGQSQVANTIASTIIRNAETEYNIWDQGSKKECDGNMKDDLARYFEVTSIGDNFDCGTFWSAAFVSYIMKKSGITFPYSSKHSYYFSRIRDNPGKYGICETKQISEIENIKVGDILCNDREKNEAVRYSDFTTQDGHCDIVIQINENNIVLIGGNVGDSVKKKTRTFQDIKGNVGEDFVGFISCI